MSDDFERLIADAQTDGKITDGDADEARQFADFLRIAGPPTVKGQESPDGKAPIDRLIEAGRLDLIDYAMPGASGEAAFWNHVPSDADVVGEPPYDLNAVACRIRCELPDPDPMQAAPRLRILDVGCGTGRLTNLMAEQWPWQTFHGVDISRKLLERAVMDGKHLDNVHYWHNDGRTLPPGLGARQYDLVYSVAMFQHIPYEAMWGYIHDVNRRLKPGGVFVFTIAHGEIDEFLNHQISDVDHFANDLMSIFDSVDIDYPDERGWVWCVVRKEEA